MFVQPMRDEGGAEKQLGNLFGNSYFCSSFDVAKMTYFIKSTIFCALTARLYLRCLQVFI